MKTSSPNKNTTAPPVHSFLNQGRKEDLFFKSQETKNPFFSRSPIQTKLEISQPGDKYEQEADLMADKIVQKTKNPYSVPRIQTQCQPCGREEEIQAKEITGNNLQASPNLASSLQNSKGKGNSLPKHTLTNMETGFGKDFSAVKIHTDSEAVQMNQELGARAFTNGSDIYFNQSNFNPDNREGKHLLAHELTHVVQQKGGQQQIQRQVCPSREPTELRDSRSPAGVIEQNAVFHPELNYLIIRDFAINRDEVPPEVTNSPDWERAMSYIIGDPSIRIALAGYSDCSGNSQENFEIRDRRASSVRTALPSEAQVKVVASLPIGTATYLTTNDTPINRAKNRSVKILIQSGAFGPEGVEACDQLTRANNIDEFLFLLRCAESKLATAGVTAPVTVLSAIRQLYYGSASWSNSQNSFWDITIAERPYPSSSDLPGTLGARLFSALQSSESVEGVAVGHLLTGMDAMAHLTANTDTRMPMSNQEIATWAGDVGSVPAQFLLAQLYNSFNPNIGSTIEEYFSEGYAKEDDLIADIESFAIRQGLNPTSSPQAGVNRPLQLSRSLSAVFLDFYRVSSSNLANERQNSKRLFLQAYGGRFSGDNLTNRAEVFERLHLSVQTFSMPFLLKKFLDRSNAEGPPPNVPDLDHLIPILAYQFPPLVHRSTELFMDWLLDS